MAFPRAQTGKALSCLSFSCTDTYTPSWRNSPFQYFIFPVWFLIPIWSSFTHPFHFTRFHLAFSSFFASISSHSFLTSTLAQPPPPPTNFLPYLSFIYPHFLSVVPLFFVFPIPWKYIVRSFVNFKSPPTSSLRWCYYYRAEAAASKDRTTCVN